MRGKSSIAADWTNVVADIPLFLLCRPVAPTIMDNRRPSMQKNTPRTRGVKVNSINAKTRLKLRNNKRRHEARSP